MQFKWIYNALAYLIGRGL